MNLVYASGTVLSLCANLWRILFAITDYFLKQEREFFPLAPDVDYSVFASPDGSSKAQSPDDSHVPSHQTAGNYM